MGKEVHLLIGFAQYYPSPDNTIRVFNDKERAEQICDELNEKTTGRSDYKEQYAKLREKYAWLPKHDSGVYDVRSHELDTTPAQ